MLIVCLRVMCLELMPADRSLFKFIEGQYVYLNCPYISPNEWHPFTISSAAGDLDFDDHVFTIHIRVFPKGWTGKLKEYFGLMNPQNKYPLYLSRRDGPKLLPGKDRGVDGQALIRVDGPHAAPTQHYHIYEHVSAVSGVVAVLCWFTIRFVCVTCCTGHAHHCWHRPDPRRRCGTLDSSAQMEEKLQAPLHQLLLDGAAR